MDGMGLSARCKMNETNVIPPSQLERLLRYLGEIFPGKDVTAADIVRIGGMSNKNFRIGFEGKQYVFRLPGNGSEGMVDRANEEYNARIGCRLGVNPAIRYFDRRTGVKLSDFMENAVTMDAETIQRPEILLKVAAIYDRIHHAPEPLNNTFNLFEEIEKYDRLIRKNQAVMYPGWDGFKPCVMGLEQRLSRLGAELCPCHNDAVPENFIQAADGTLYLIDWEYSGMNDPMADYAALFLESDFSEASREFFLNACYPDSRPPHVEERILCYEILWDTLWAQWTVIKEACGDDFGDYGIHRFRRARKNYESLKRQDHEIH